MQTLKKKRRIRLISFGIVALVLSVVLIGYAFRDGINYFRSPAQVLADPPSETEVFRLGGLVEEGSLVRGQGLEVRFNVTDGKGTIPVHFSQVLPDLFSEGQGMIGTGRYINNVFEAHEILAKHDETYMPKEVIDALKEQGVYEAPES